MPTIDNSEAGSGRVTRSLRKRLTSVDTDSSSRPGTPVINSLQTLPETVTPSKRSTRRTSITTPVPTPSKVKGRMDITEIVNSPARRNTRRRSVSTNDQEDAPMHVKSKEPTFDVVKEEETGEKSPGPKSKRSTRHSPKSALSRQSEQTRSETPKSEQICISPEVSPRVLIHMKHSKVMLKKEHIEENNLSVQKKNKQKVSKDSTPQKDSPSMIDSNPEKVQSSDECDSVQNVVIEELVTPGKNAETSLKGDDAKTNVSTSMRTPLKKNVEASPEGSSIRTENERTLSATEVTEISSETSEMARRNKLKSVGFNNTVEEDEEKNVFPKTPGLTKSKSYILDSSKPNENEAEATNKSESKLEYSHEEIDKDCVKEDVDEDENEILSTKTPYKLKLNSVESSTPIQSTSAKKSKNDSSQKDTSTKNSEGSKEEFAFPKSWSHSVSGTANDLVKIDSIESEESLQKKSEERRSINKAENKSKPSKKKRILHDDSDEDSVEEDDLLGEEEEEEKEREKSMFVDDEAMEVADGEESMDSEERAYLEENEIPVYAESIGSVDTVEEECEEEADEDDAAFVVSDNEEILQEDSDSDASKKVGKKYKRIVHNADSSDEDERDKKDDDFCLLVDSSMEEMLSDIKANISTKEKARPKSNTESINDSNDQILPESVPLLEEKCAKSSAKRKSLKGKKEDATNEEIEAQEQEKPRNKPDKDADKVTDVEEVDEKSTKKERKSLNKRKSLGVEQKSMISSEGENNGECEDISMKDSNKRNPLQNKEQEKEIGDESSKNTLNDSNLNGETTTYTEATPRKNLSKKERKSLNMSKSCEANRKSLVKLEGDNDEHEEDKPVKSSDKRKSLKNHEDVHVGDEMETENQMKSFGDAEMNTDEEASTSKLSKKERKSLNKSKSHEQENLNTSQAKEDNIRCSPYKSKSLKDKGKHETSVIDCADIEAKSPNKSLSQVEMNTATPGRKLSKMRGVSESNSKEVNESNNEDNEMVDVGESEENEDFQKETEIKPAEKSWTKSRLSLNKSKSEISRHANENHENDKEKSLNTEDGEEISLHKCETDSDKELTTGIQTDEEPPKEKNNSPLKQTRKSLNKSVANEVGYECFKGMSENSSNDGKDQTEDGDEEKLGIKPLDSFKNSLNTSKNKKKKSLIRTSTEEISDDTEERQRSANKSKSEKSFLFVEDGSDTETTSAIEVSSRVSEGKSQNSSRVDRKSLNQSRPDKKEEEVKSSPRKGSRPNDESDCQDDEEHNENAESDTENNENVAEISKVMEFLGEEETEGHSPPNLNSTRRKSINTSKLDETFHLESNNASLSRRDSLHRNVLKKSLNQSKIISDTKNKTEFKNDVESEDGDDDSDVSAEFSAEEEVEVVKKILPDKGLSVSLSGIECKKRKSKGIEEQVHKSFTIGVSLRNTTANDKKDNNASSPDSITSKCDASFSEKDDLEKIEKVEVVGPYKPRNSLSKILSTTSDDNKTQKKSKRFSLYMHGDGASQSFVENLAEEKNKLKAKQNRKSNSFCGVMAPCEEPEMQPEETQSSQPQTQSNDASKTENKTDIQRILSRCDEILEAANRAKREAKLNAKKTKVKKPKWMDKEEKAIEEEEVNIPLVSKKELKRKEKMKKELAKAIKHSTAMLNTIDPKLIKKLKAPEKPEPIVAAESVTSKRLPADFLDELEEAPKPKKKKTKEIESTPPSDKENSKKSSNKNQPHSEGTSDGEKKKKKRSKEILQTASGPVIVEPSTPTKLRYQNGFRESPKTPVGFKIQDVDDNREQSRKRSRKLFSASAAFEEKDLSHSDLKTSSKKTKKRKFHIEEPVYSLPKTQWTSSGVFVEEDVHTVHHPLANSTATQFMVSSLSGSKNPAKTSKVVSSATLSSALNFKKNALFNEKVKREPARKLIHRKERKLINNRY